MIASMLHRAFGLMLVPRGLTVDSPQLGTRFMMFCIAIIAVIIAVDSRLMAIGSTPGFANKTANLFNSLSYLVSPFIGVAGLFGIAWLMVAQAGRKWIGALFLVLWVINTVGLLLIFELVVMPAIQKELAGSGAAFNSSISGNELWTSVIALVFQLVANMAIILAFQCCGYKFRIVDRSRSLQSPISIDPESKEGQSALEQA
jgi:hypothetical protein